MVPFDRMVRRDIRVDRTIDFMSLREGFCVGDMGVSAQGGNARFSPSL
jgi:hypothetical protein